MQQHMPLIVVELVLVFGGALAFAWWQLRDLDREKRKREARQQQQQQDEPQRQPAPERDDAA
jgi:cytoskeletal protein RodZ